MIVSDLFYYFPAIYRKNCSEGDTVPSSASGVFPRESSELLSRASKINRVSSFYWTLMRASWSFELNPGLLGESD
jgi:hypothetical protein